MTYKKYGSCGKYPKTMLKVAGFHQIQMLTLTLLLKNEKGKNSLLLCSIFIKSKMALKSTINLKIYIQIQVYPCTTILVMKLLAPFPVIPASCSFYYSSSTF